jgi:hypothetical protein
MAQFRIRNNSQWPVNIELAYQDVTHHYRWGLKNGEVADFSVAPVGWFISVFLACDATKLDYEKTADADAAIKIDNKPYYVAGTMPEGDLNALETEWGEILQVQDPLVHAALVQAMVHAYTARHRLAGLRLGGLAFDNQRLDANNLVVPYEGLLAEHNQHMDKLRRLTLAVSQEVFDGTTLKVVTGTRDQQFSVEGGEFDFAYNERLLLVTVDVKHALSLNAAHEWWSAGSR